MQCMGYYLAASCTTLLNILMYKTLLVLCSSNMVIDGYVYILQNTCSLRQSIVVIMTDWLNGLGHNSCIHFSVIIVGRHSSDNTKCYFFPSPDRGSTCPRPVN